LEDERVLRLKGVGVGFVGVGFEELFCVDALPLRDERWLCFVSGLD